MMVVDLDLVYEKIRKYFENNYRDLMKTGTLLLLEFPINDLNGFLLENGIECPGEFRARGVINYTEPHCIFEGKKIVGLHIRETQTEPSVNVYVEGEEDLFIGKLTDAIASFIITFNRTFFEAFVRGFLSDEDSVILTGYNDPKAFAIAILSLSGGKMDINYRYIDVGKFYTMKIPKSELVDTRFDTLFLKAVGKDVIAVPISREEVFKLIMSEHENLKAELMKNLATNVELQKLIDKILEEVEQEEKS